MRKRPDPRSGSLHLCHGPGLTRPPSTGALCRWRWCFWLGSLPAAALILLSPSLVESPRWLGQQGEWGAAERAVRSLQAPSAAGAAAGRQAMIDLRAGASSPGTPEVSLLGLFSNQYRKCEFQRHPARFMSSYC